MVLARLKPNLLCGNFQDKKITEQSEPFIIFIPKPPTAGMFFILNHVVENVPNMLVPGRTYFILNTDCPSLCPCFSFFSDAYIQ